MSTETRTGVPKTSQRETSQESFAYPQTVEKHRRPKRIRLPSLRLRVSERKLLLLVVDTLLINAALFVALLVSATLLPGGGDFASLGKWFITLSVVWWGAAIFFDSYDLARAATTTYSVRSGAIAALATVFVYSLIPIVTPPLQSRGFLFVFAGLAVAAVGTWRLAYARLFVQPWFKQQILVVGAGWAGKTLAKALQQAPEDDANPFRGTGYSLLGFVDDDLDRQGSLIEGAPILGTSENLVNLAEFLHVDEIVVAITHRHAIDDQLFDALLRCRERGFRLSTMSILYERLLGRVPVDHIGRDLYMVVPMHESASERLYHFAKRLFDILFACVGLIGVVLLMPIVALINALTSPGPLFYRQKRVGQGGRTFEMVKFRSMIPEAECNTGAVWACNSDDRITPAGRILRKTRLDELPQMINILVGDMSLIGPRPERPEFVDQLAHEIHFYRARHAVRPGITGWAQVQYDYGNSMEDAKVKLEYDLYYVKHAGLMLDIRILLTTLPVMIAMKGL